MVTIVRPDDGLLAAVPAIVDGQAPNPQLRTALKPTPVVSSRGRRRFRSEMTIL
jgi:hypothetical protein